MKFRKRVMIFIEGEGGGDPDRPPARKALKGEFRKAWGKFLKPLRDHAWDEGVRGGFDPIACGDGQSALDRFSRPLPKDEGALRILLIDAEGPVADVAKPWAAIGKRGPGWAGDDDLYLMVQCLESWIVADIDAVRQHYDTRGKPCFDERKLPKWPDPEGIHRHTVQKALENATANCGEPYSHALGNVIIARIRLEVLANHRHMRSPARLLNGLKQRISMYAAG